MAVGMAMDGAKVRVVGVPKSVTMCVAVGVAMGVATGVAMGVANGGTC